MPPELAVVAAGAEIAPAEPKSDDANNTRYTPEIYIFIVSYTDINSRGPPEFVSDGEAAAPADTPPENAPPIYP